MALGIHDTLLAAYVSVVPQHHHLRCVLLITERALPLRPHPSPSALPNLAEAQVTQLHSRILENSRAGVTTRRTSPQARWELAVEPLQTALVGSSIHRLGAKIFVCATTPRHNGQSQDYANGFSYSAVTALLRCLDDSNELSTMLDEVRSKGEVVHRSFLLSSTPSRQTRVLSAS